jgi:quercetin dioxygenase-like cupin family protein
VTGGAVRIRAGRSGGRQHRDTRADVIVIIPLAPPALLRCRALYSLRRTSPHASGEHLAKGPHDTMNARPVMRAAAVTAAVAAGLALLTSTASATPGTGVTSTEVSHTSIAGKDVIVREITIQPGGSTGWHYHDGTLVAVVKEGTLTHYDAQCHVDGVYDAGDTVYEPSGADRFHIGRNEGETPMVLGVVYVLPAGAPLSEDHDAPACDR